ncbi:MAG: DUF3006 domain-containing protein [bacterium]|nr:DUF3006 domain-containing protein [bacterium]
MLYIDRIESGFAVLVNDGKSVDVSIELLPENAKEGDRVKFEKGRYILETDTSIKQRIKEKQDMLFD